MPINFSDDELDAVVGVEEPTYDDYEQQQELEEQMSEVETRLEVAQYYRLILNDSLFENPPNPQVAQMVEQEIRGFIRERMGALMGVQAPPPKVQKIFTDEEVKALRTLAQPDVKAALAALAAKLLKKPAILDPAPIPQEAPPPPAKATPTLKKIARPVGRPRKNPESVVQSAVSRQPTNRKKNQPVAPIGVRPVPMPSTKEGIEMASAVAAQRQAQAALQGLSSSFSGKVVSTGSGE